MSDEQTPLRRVRYLTLSELNRDLQQLWMWRAIRQEMTKVDDGQQRKQIIERMLEDMCAGYAEKLGVSQLWKESQEWPNSNFPNAWEKWCAAWEKWIGGPRRLDSNPHVAPSEYLYAQKLFLLGLRHGKGNDPEFYKSHSQLLWAAADAGDVEFFNQFAQTKRQKTDPRLVQFSLMRCWMPAALWACNQDAVGKFLLGKTTAWGNSKPNNPGEAARRAWQKLGLWHEDPPPIVDFDKDWRPICRE